MKRKGLEPIQNEVDRLRETATEAVRIASERFFAEYDKDPDPLRLAAWFVPRCWREIEYVFMLNEEIRRYGLSFERKHITALSKHSFQEAQHYEMVGRIIEHLGGEVPVTVPESARAWSDLLWDCLDRHRLAAIAAWNISETAAGGSFDATLAASERYQDQMPEAFRVYKQIVKDENFHVGLGQLLLDRYAENDKDREEILRAMREMVELVAYTYKPENVVVTGR
ncbi:hypothetical protein Rxyl_1908 [Rubrobacter xylanophilus DSM 9941]|uniref:Ferritin-like domain-containing protein n=1 Tax=Rubrobacter xylanophilus (strain DSM 9941 / JCM 11954 / NBRC 16129 / PRD-1) TaxID=266117 RepID=Q1AUS3_RUBXD|nr:hypothetical protein [Rubrobacter xylanophilus]ABG04855.1 hypothetical protein Rxyl_1908 [Rubrobacter xylanophilus DSM 9941]